MVTSVKHCCSGPQAIMATLLIADPHGEPRRFEISEDGETTIGRQPENAVCIPDPHLSSTHAVLRYDAKQKGFFVRDLGSHNGTRVNGARLGAEEVRLQPGDRMVLGILESTLLLDAVARPLAPKPLQRPSIDRPKQEIPIIDVETIKAATRRPIPDPSDTDGKTVDLEELCRGLIQRIDLIDDLLERYRDVKKDPEVVSDLDVLKQSFQDMLAQYEVKTFSFAPDTEIDREMRRKIQIIDTLREGKAGKKPGSNHIVATLHDGYLRQPEGAKPVILRKAHVTARKVVAS